LIKDVCDSCEKPEPNINSSDKPVAKAKIAIDDVPVSEIKNLRIIEI